MTSDQKYEGKNNSAQNSSATVNSDQQAPLPADKRQDLDEYTGYISGDLEAMLSIVADVNATTSNRHPITVVADLLEFWLTNGNPNLNHEPNRQRMGGAMSVITSWRQLGSLSDQIYYYRGEIDQLEKGTDAPAPAPSAHTVINLPIRVTPDTPDQRSELTLLRDALQCYAEHLRQQSDLQQRPALLVDADNVEGILENLIAGTFTALGQSTTRKGVCGEN